MWANPETRNGRCRYCGAGIVWVTTPNGRKIAFDPPLTFTPSLLDGDVSMLTTGGGDAVVVNLDRARTRRHVDTCTAFDPPLAGVRRTRGKGTGNHG